MLLHFAGSAGGCSGFLIVCGGRVVRIILGGRGYVVASLLGRRWRLGAATCAHDPVLETGGELSTQIVAGAFLRADTR